MAFLDKLKTVLAKNADKVDTAIDKAGDIVDKKTQGKYAQHVDKVQDARQEGRGQEHRRPNRAGASDAAVGPGSAICAPAREPAAAATPDGPTDPLVRMAKLSVSVDVPLPPEKAWECASDLSRYKEWLSIHRVWRSKLPETLEKGTVIESIVEVKGMLNRIKWTIVHFKPPEAMTLNGEGRGRRQGQTHRQGEAVSQ